jgi:cytidyltransferase-like protein
VASKTVITFGTFDVFHVGHVRVLNRSAALGDRLVVGVSSDKLNFAKRVATRSLPRRSVWRSSPMSRLSMQSSSKRASNKSVSTS